MLQQATAIVVDGHVYVPRSNGALVWIGRRDEIDGLDTWRLAALVDFRFAFDRRHTRTVH